MIRKAAGLFVVLWIAGGMAFIVWNSRKLAELPLPVLGDVGAFELSDQSGRLVKADKLNGKVWIADFIFTSCAGPCPTMSALMRRFTEQLSDADQVRFVSFSVDPERDTPERLAEYGVRYHADPDRWFFLTGDKDAIYDLAEKKFRLAAADTDPALRSPHTISHSSKFVLVDKAGKIRGYYDSAEPFQLKAMVHNARRLTLESQP